MQGISRRVILVFVTALRLAPAYLPSPLASSQQNRRPHALPIAGLAGRRLARGLALFADPRMSAGSTDPDDLADGADEQESKKSGFAFSLSDVYDRKRQIEQDSVLENRWREAECWRESRRGVLPLNDWVRRLSVDWPFAAIGTASGAVILANVVNSTILSQTTIRHVPYVDNAANDVAIPILFGPYDGGGVLAIALTKDHLVSAGREGGANIWRVEDEELKLQGSLPLLSTIAGALHMRSENDGSVLWVGSFDNYLRRWNLPREGQASASLELLCGAPVVSIATWEERQIVACGTAAGDVELFNSSDGRELGKWSISDSLNSDDEHLISITISQNPYLNGEIIVGSSTGRLWRRRLADAELNTSLFDESLAGEALVPKHGGAVVGLQTAVGSLLVSGARDGTLRLWDLADRTSQSPCLHAIQGYKVWLGSVEIVDNCRVVSDGADNRVMILDFSEDFRENDSDNQPAANPNDAE